MPHKWHVIAKLQLGKEDDRRGQGQQWILDSSLGLTIGLSSVHALGKGQGLPHYHDRDMASQEQEMPSGSQTMHTFMARRPVRGSCEERMLLCHGAGPPARADFSTS